MNLGIPSEYKWSSSEGANLAKQKVTGYQSACSDFHPFHVLFCPSEEAEAAQLSPWGPALPPSYSPSKQASLLLLLRTWPEDPSAADLSALHLFIHSPLSVQPPEPGQSWDLDTPSGSSVWMAETQEL